MSEYILIRANKRSISLCVKPDLSVVVRAPLSMPKHDIDCFVHRHNEWIKKHQTQMSLRARPAFTSDEITVLKTKAAALLPQKVEMYSRIMGVEVSGIKITSATTRWGSCSGKNSLCFSYRLMLLPDDLIDYIVVHELSHIRVKNHSKAFYDEVSRYMPDYKERVHRIKSL